MKNYWIISFTFLLFLFFLPTSGLCKRGCCSHHGGVCGDRCCDGTPLSAKCRGSSSTYIPPVAPKSSGAYSPPYRQTYDKPSVAPAPTVDTDKNNKESYLVVFKNGQKIKTTMAWEEDNQVKFYRYGAVIGYPKDKIERIEPLEE
ncbi:MAG: hypothetical protein R2941_17475 [Desulfobacterales bacterium]